MGKERGEPQSENEYFQCCCIACAALWRDCMTLTRTEERRLNAFEIGLLRNIAAMSWDELFRNDDIRAKLCQPSVSMKVNGARVKWFRHIEIVREEI